MIPLFVYSFFLSFSPSVFRSFGPLVCSLVHSFLVRSFVCCVCSFVRCFRHSLVRSPLSLSTRSFVPSLARPLLCSPVLPFNYNNKLSFTDPYEKINVRQSKKSFSFSAGKSILLSQPFSDTTLSTLQTEPLANMETSDI